VNVSSLQIRNAVVQALIELRDTTNARSGFISMESGGMQVNGGGVPLILAPTVVIGTDPGGSELVRAASGRFTNLNGTLTSSAQPNITSVGTLTSLTVSGNTTFNGPTITSAFSTGTNTALNVQDLGYSYVPIGGGLGGGGIGNDIPNNRIVLVCDGIGGMIELPRQDTSTTVGAAGAASALPANPTGYMLIRINGTNRKIPFYAV
jgi:hypothetical protein